MGYLPDKKGSCSLLSPYSPCRCPPALLDFMVFLGQCFCNGLTVFDALQFLAELLGDDVLKVTIEREREQPDFNQEPRIKITSSVIPQDATHPFFWAGYTLIDCGILTAPEAPTDSKVEQVE